MKRDVVDELKYYCESGINSWDREGKSCAKQAKNKINILEA
jgi:hypothetical protein